MLFNVTHDGNLKLRELDIAARVIAEVVDSTANIIFGTVIDPSVGDAVHMTVIATGFSEQAPTVGLSRTAAASRPSGLALELPGISNEEDAELPAFLRRNIRSMSEISANGDREARMAERR